MVIAGLTGGTGAGKSSAARRFSSHGISVVDADKIGHALVATGGDAVDDIVATFGETIHSCGTISRERLGALVFSDSEALDQLNAIMKPRIYRAIEQQCAALSAAGTAVCLVDAALLGDGGSLEPWVQSLILVCCPAVERVARLVAHRGLTSEVAWERVRAQVDPKTKRSLSRWTIENDGTLDDLNRQVDRIAQALLLDSGSTRHGTL